jgi:hypothetical protein
MKDIWNDKNKHVLNTMLWMAEALIDAAIRQANLRLNSQKIKDSQ